MMGTLAFNLSLSWTCVGFVEIVQFIINSAGNGDFVKRLLATTDVEGDTVSLSKTTTSQIYLSFICC